MPRRKSRKNKEDVEEEDEGASIGGTQRTVLTIVFFALGIIFLLGVFSVAGKFGDGIDTFLTRLFGWGHVVVPFVLIGLGVLTLRSKVNGLPKRRWISIVILFIALLSIFQVLGGDGKGGWVGLIGKPIEQGFDTVAAVVLLIAVMLVGAVLAFEKELGIPSFLSAFWDKLTGKEKSEPEEETDAEPEVEEEAVEVEEEAPTDKKPLFGIGKKSTLKEKAEDEELDLMKGTRSRIKSNYVFPPLSLLSKDAGKPGTGDVKANANLIKRTLENFGIDVEMDEVSIGPTVTRYAMKPAEGVKLARIIGLQNELALALAAHPVRIEAPIPGTSLVGVEIPNRSKSTVGLATLLGEDTFQKSPKPLLVAVGKGVSGRSHFIDIAKMPHGLIAGATGSGKSVMIHTLVTSLLYRNGPDQLRFIMVDPKRVELTLYNKIPHLLTPVVTDPKKAILSLKWAAKEMDRRYEILESQAVRDVQSYHKKIVEPAYAKASDKDEENEDLPERMPYIVIIIDELADIMTAYPRELESAVVRLAQMSRAVGIHLVLSTQRPSVNVITGLIKANVPSRIALQVASQIDSRTILDAPGAEKLLGAGDALFMSAEMSKPERVQSPYISEEEVKSVVKFIADNAQDELIDEINLGESSSGGRTIFDASLDDGDDDELYEEARDTVMRAGKASTSYLQRKLKVGYSRAARLMDILEEKGIIGPQDGSRPREVIEKHESTIDAIADDQEHAEEMREKEESAS